MTIYLDKEFCCHMSETASTTQSIETDYFDGKCPAYIEGYRYVPSGSTWTRSDGVEFRGEMVSPWKPWQELDAAQRDYEREQIAEYESALTEIEEALGVNV